MLVLGRTWGRKNIYKVYLESGMDMLDADCTGQQTLALYAQPCPNLAQSQTCFVCNCDCDDEVNVCRNRGRRRSLTRNMQDTHSVCRDCLPELLRRGNPMCGICREQIDPDFIFQVDQAQRPALHEAIAEGEHAVVFDHNAAFSEEVILGELEANGPQVEFFSFILPEGTLPFFSDWQFWSVNRASWWRPENIPKHPEVLWNHLSSEMADASYSMPHCINSLHFLALRGYHDEFVKLLETYWQFAEAGVIDADRIDWALPRILFDLFSLTEQIPFNNNDDRTRNILFLLEEREVDFEYPIYFGLSTLEMTARETWGRLDLILEFCKLHKDSLFGERNQRHWLKFRSSNSYTLLHFLMENPPEEIMSSNESVMERYAERDNWLIATAMEDFLAIFGSAPSPEHDLFLNHKNHQGKKALEMALSDPPEVSSIQPRQTVNASLMEWQMKSRRVSIFVNYLYNLDFPLQVDVSKAIRYYMTFMQDIMSHLFSYEGLPYSRNHYGKILSYMCGPVKKLIQTHIKFVENFGTCAEEIDLVEILVHMVRVQHLESVSLVVSELVTPSNINRSVVIKGCAVTALESVDYCPVDISHSSRQDMRDFLIRNGARAPNYWS